MEKKDGQRVRREYALLGVAIRFAGEHPCEAPLPPLSLQNPTPLPAGEAAPPLTQKPSLTDRMKKQWHALIGK
jgi:hypothetical protein